jgi:hypothetical protein
MGLRNQLLDPAIGQHLARGLFGALASGNGETKLSVRNPRVGTFGLRPPLMDETTAFAAWRQAAKTNDIERINMNMKTRSLVELNVPNERHNQNTGLETASPSTATEGIGADRKLGRRSFVKGLALGAASFLPVRAAFADAGGRKQGLGHITENDAAILRFLAAAEILETDLWQQYTEFVDLDSPYTDALEAIDDDMPTYVDQNTADEFSHQSFLNAFLAKMGKQPVNLEPFRTLPSSPVAPVQTGRLTNLMHLNVDTSWYVRYRNSGNPDFGDVFGQAVNIVNRPAIPVQNQALYTVNQIQAIANTAAFHFAMIEQGGSSLYDALSFGCGSLLALRIVTSIGGTEVAHFEIWNDKAGDAPPVDSGDGLVFPDLNLNPATTTSQVMPKPCKFISTDLPLCSVIRPTSSALAGATAAAQFLTETGLFAGQSDAFFRALFSLAAAADKAARQGRDD